MPSWIISVCGIALLTVLCDVVLPDGNTKKYVRTVIGIVLSFSMLLPISKFFSERSIEDVSFQSDVAIQQNFIDGIEEQKTLAKVQRVQAIVASFDLASSSVSVQSNGYLCLRVECDKQTLLELQNALSTLDSKIALVWSDSGG